MKNTIVLLWGLLLVTMVAAESVTHSNRSTDSDWGTDSDWVQEEGLETTEMSINFTESLREGDKRSESELQRISCNGNAACTNLGGSCIANPILCSGGLVTGVCGGGNCQCCIPGTVEVKIQKQDLELQSANWKLDNITKHLEKNLEDQLNRIEMLASTIHQDIKDLKLGQNSAYDVIQNINEEITKLNGAYHQMYMHEVSFLTSGGIAKATSIHSSHTPIDAFGTRAHLHNGPPYTVPVSVWFEFPEPIRVVKYSFKSRNDEPYTVTDGPSKYIFWASNHNDCSNESLWVIIYEDISGTPFKTANVPKIKSIDNKYFYRCYGFKVIDVPGRDGSKYVTIGNIRFYSVLGGK